jgi:GR25 family glycosyltransferase involved in LPS biosynthesis
VSSLALYVINLDDRWDRLQEFSEQIKKYSLDVQRIRAVPYQEIKDDHYVTLREAACWKSHQKAAEEFLASNKEFAIVFEDDAILSKASVKMIEKIQTSNLRGIDVLQIGYLTHGRKLDFLEFDNFFGNYLDLRTYLWSYLPRFDIVFRNWIRITRYLLRFLCQTILLISRQEEISKMPRFRKVQEYVLDEAVLRNYLGVKVPLIYHSYEAGTHCYLMSRNFAKVLCGSNTPSYLAADLMLMSIAKSRNFAMLRLSKSLVKQSDSISSIRVGRHD